MATATGTRQPPPVGFRFDVRFIPTTPVGGLTGAIASVVETAFAATGLAADGPDAHFQEVSGISVEFETETVKDGAESMFTQKLPLKPSYSDLVLKRGLLLKSALVPWINFSLNNKLLYVIPVDVEVALKNEQNDTLISYYFVNAWIRKWSISGFNAMESALVLESLELSYQYFRINWSP